MRKNLMICLLLAVSVFGAEPVKMRVTGSRVNLRARPMMSGELIGQVAGGDELVLAREETAEEGWTAVKAPQWVDCWIKKEFVTDGKVNVPKLNVRSGASLNYGVVSVITNGFEVEIRDESDPDWYKIAPPENTVVWISSEFVETQAQEASAEPAVVPAVETEKAADVEDKSVGEIFESLEDEHRKQQVPLPEELTEKLRETVTTDEFIEKIAAAVAEKQEAKTKVEDLGPVLPIRLEIDPQHSQGGDFQNEGVLRLSDSAALRRLVASDGTTLCFVRGNEQQMKEYLGRKMMLQGRKYYARGVREPIVVPSLIMIVSGRE